ncbi:uncharacterized membrane protein (UPF0127 family) [Rhodovulum iodosum]|uniref:Uncharacterized membrane protein (UPF0127 family) n=1 Tax=Rhodovulum iodosum TaxID=68291 RepID=A0ABV3XQS7_9RHOB|nr:DUF192 domain-containing protein [Rhodovulum robiginosum]RSK35870.1 DUF192 domain-containing protein [Rhodovulum robiginosum]
MWGVRLVLALTVAVSLSGAARAQCADTRVDLRGEWGQARFSVELADDAAERSRGLMFRERLPQGAGMLFVYDRPGRAVFWMKNTLIPLDMIFLGPRGRVLKVHENAVPGDLTGIDGGPGVKAVLEINGGLARAIGIAPGSEMRHPAFGNAAAWSCAP